MLSEASVSDPASTVLVPCMTFVVTIPKYSVMYVARFVRTAGGPDFYSFSFKHTPHQDPHGTDPVDFSTDAHTLIFM
jgi:hypothetical protein